MHERDWVRHIPSPPPKGLTLRIGGQSRKVWGGHGSSQVALAPETSVYLDPRSAPVDYAAEAQVGHASDRSFCPVFTGNVVRAQPSGDWLQMEAAGQRALAEAELPFLRATGVPASELLRTVVEERGGELRVEGVHEPSPENDVFCVQAPIFGLESTAPIRLRSVWLEPRSCAPDAWEEFEREFATGFASVASTYVVARTLVAAERRGLALIDSALDLITTTNLYSYAEMPDGRLCDYERAQTLARGHRPDVVLVRGISSRRCWLRETTPRTYGAKEDLAGFESRWGDAMQTPIPREILWAMGALRGAVDNSLASVQRNQVLWVALEFYASSSSVTKLVTKSSRKRARDAISNLGLPQDQSKRLIEQVNRCNEPGLMAKVVSQAQTDGAGLTEEERALLSKLRDLRNDSQHGRGGACVDPKDLTRGAALVARLLVFKWLAGKQRDRREEPM